MTNVDKNSIANLAKQQQALANKASNQPAEKPTEKPELTKAQAIAERGCKISLAQTGVPKKPVSVKVTHGKETKEYHTLCDALRAYGFNVQGDWIKCRKLLKAGKATMTTQTGDYTFEMTA